MKVKLKRTEHLYRHHHHQHHHHRIDIYHHRVSVWCATLWLSTELLSWCYTTWYYHIIPF